MVQLGRMANKSDEIASGTAGMLGRQAVLPVAFGFRMVCIFRVPSRAIFQTIFGRVPFKANQPKKEALSSHGHWASEHFLQSTLFVVV